MQLGEQVIKGKIVFFNFPMNPTYIRTFRAYGESGAYRTRGPGQGCKIWRNRSDGTFTSQ